jgi:hypothetical protein
VQEKMRETEDDMETQEEEVKTLNASIKSAHWISPDREYSGEF